MKLYRVDVRQRLRISLAEAWDFFSDPANLQAITPPWLDFRITSELPPRVYAGLIITYRVTVLPRVPVTWVTEITHVDEPRLFVDEQRFGPYRFWHHQHLFQEVPGGIEMRDIVHYAPPRPGSAAINRWVVGPRVRQIFQFRNRLLQQRFGELD